MTVTYQTLESARYVHGASRIDCYLCGNDNLTDAEHCRECRAPMALAHQATAQCVLPRFLAIIGASGVGKTVYLGMLLDMLSRHGGDLQLLARGAFSLSLQQAVIGALARCEFPPKTRCEPEHWNWMHCQLSAAGQRRPWELMLPDFSGEALFSEIDHALTYPGIRALLWQARGRLVLIDAPALARGCREQAYYGRKLLHYLAELPHEIGKRAKTPLAIVMTKADQCEESFLDLRGFAEQHAAGLIHVLEERFPNFRIFAASVVGSCYDYQCRGYGRLSVPSRIEPQGVIEPFLWLIREMEKQGCG
ncbi:MAG: hypothetical protein QM811_01590 [Pirellulales bacterium]